LTLKNKVNIKSVVNAPAVVNNENRDQVAKVNQTVGAPIDGPGRPLPSRRDPA